ncbi:HutD family protein [Aquicoccus sp. SU-CL01552]|uniref:HutD/Ves family protein n=1 Tax=Aquicoccus sp. SU-CL01552 TaxID=3127656 RepID=UPI00310C060C
MQVLKHGDLVEMPWKNGGGITRRIAKGKVAENPAWTLSRADVACDGPFSDFTGMMRVLTVVSGRGMTLDTPNGSLEAGLWQPTRFDGGWKIQSRLRDGPLTDLNLMFDPRFCEGDVLTRQGPLQQDIAAPGHGVLAFHVLSGSPAINAVPLSTGDTAIVSDAGAEVRLAKGDALLELRVSYLDQSDAIRLCIAS